MDDANQNTTPAADVAGDGVSTTDVVSDEEEAEGEEKPVESGNATPVAEEGEAEAEEEDEEKDEEKDSNNEKVAE